MTSIPYSVSLAFALSSPLTSGVNVFVNETILIKQWRPLTPLLHAQVDFNDDVNKDRCHDFSSLPNRSIR